jgi:hypothetical protein
VKGKQRSTTLCCTKWLFLNLHNKCRVIHRTFSNHILGHGGPTTEPPQTVSTTPKQPGGMPICNKNGLSAYAFLTVSPTSIERFQPVHVHLYQLTSLTNCGIHLIQFHHFIRVLSIGSSVFETYPATLSQHKVKLYLPLQFSSPRFLIIVVLASNLPSYQAILSYMVSCL